MLANEKIAIAAHLHVLLRRKLGRVTDTEWMASNREYAMEIVRFAREKAIEHGHPEICVLANRLADVMAASSAAAPPAAAVRPAQTGPESGFGDTMSDGAMSASDAVRERKQRDESRYVKSLR
jgi:hypothetical protein